MDRLFLAMSFYRRRKFEECAEVCTQLLQKNPYDQVVYFLIDSTVNLTYTSTNIDYEMLLIFFPFSEAFCHECFLVFITRHHGV